MSAPVVVHCIAVQPWVCTPDDPDGRRYDRRMSWMVRWFSAATSTARFEEEASKVRAGSLPTDRYRILSLTAAQVEALPTNQRLGALQALQLES